MVDENDRTEYTGGTDRTAPPRQADGLPVGSIGVEGVGSYRLLQKIGEGGMGEVFEALQEKPIQRRVAFKVIKKGMDTKEVIARFDSERQALALMDHRAIAKVYDAGATDTGRPFFVMEYIKGISITEYCDKAQLETRQRLELFIQVCEGVQHAHQKGIIHRDIKPSNVLVSIEEDRPVPKIIDFGLAKATAHSLTEHSLFTELGQLMGTPEYMSPEQAEMSGLDVDTRTDVYSLGALLYELLVGSQPFESKALRESGFDELRRKIREVEPPKPSTRLSMGGEDSSTQARNRHTDPRALSKQLKGDLDWICLKAMEKDRVRRYASANALAADIRRYTNHEPVVAGPPHASYRMRKFVRRHRLGVIAASLVLLAILLGIAGTTVGMLRAFQAERLASEEAEATRRVADFLVGLFEVSDPDEARGNSVTAREILDIGAEQIRDDLREQPVIRATLMHTMGRVYRNLGLFEDAGSLLEEAVELRRGIGGSRNSDVAAILTDLGAVYSNKASYAAAESVLSSALEMRERALGTDDPELAATLSNLAIVHRHLGDYRQAEELYQRVRKIQVAAFGPRHPDVARTQNDLANLYFLEGKFDEAGPLFEASLDVWEETLGANHPDLARGLNNLAMVYDNQQKHAEAIPLYERALKIHEKVFGTEHPRYAQNLNNLAFAFYRTKDYESARPLFERALAIKERINGPDHPSVARTANNLANLYKDQKNYAMAEPYYRRALRIREAALGPDHPDVGWSLGDLGILFREKGDFATAEPLFQRALAVFERSTGEASYGAAWTLGDLGILERERGNYESAERYFQRAIASFEGSLGTDHVDLAECLDNYAQLLGMMGRDEEAGAIRSRADGIRKLSVGGS
jgi:non-specific serine/threonine protein kinase/serine/threonine-protein kinase